MAPRSVSTVQPRTAPPMRRKVAPVEERPAPPPIKQEDSYTASDVVGQVVMLPVNAVFFVGNASLMTAKLLIFQVAHPFQLDIPRVLKWLNSGMQGEVPTNDPDLLALLIRTQNQGFADKMTGYIVDHPQAKGDVVAVMRWAIATQGKGVPPTNDPRLLGTLIGMENAGFAQLMMGFLDAHPQAGADVATVMQWAIRTRGTGAPQTNDAQLLGTLIATQNAPVAKALLDRVKANPRSQGEVAKVMRWAMETHGKGMPPTEDPKLLATLIATQEPKFGKLLQDFLNANPTAGRDVTAVARWAIQTRGKGMPPTHNARLLAALIATQEPAFGKLLSDFEKANPDAEDDVADVARWAIETHGKGLPPTHHAKLLATLIATQEPTFGKLMQEFLAANPGLEKDVAEVERWAIDTHGKGLPPTDNPKLLATLISTQEPAFAQLMQDFLKSNPGAGKDVADVERWAIQTRGEGLPPTHNAKLLGTLIQSKEQAFGKLMLDFLDANPEAAQDVAEVERWAIETRGKGVPPTNNPKLLGTLIRSQQAEFGQLMLDYLKTHPQAGAEVAKVERWAIETKGVGVPPTEDPALLATLIGTKEPKVAQMLLGHVQRCPQEVAKVAKWAIATQGHGEPPTNDPRLLASLIGLKVPDLAQELDAYIVKHPKQAADVAAMEKWLIASGGKPSGLPPKFTPGVLWILAKYARR